MSAFEITYIIFAALVFFGAMVPGDFYVWFMLNISVACLGFIFWAFSDVNSASYETHGEPARVLSQIEVPDGILIYYLDFNGESKQVKYTQYEDVEKLKNGATLHLTTNHAWVNFGPDKETIEVKIK